MQIPSVQLDLVAEDFTNAFVANRNPQPDEVQIPSEALIEFDVFGTVIGLSVTVDEVVAYTTAGGVQNGWELHESGDAIAVDSNTTHYALISPELFPTGHTVQVVVTQALQTAIWSFVTYDVTPPLFATVAAVNKDQVKVVFNEPVYMGGAEPGDALNPDSYVIERVSRPAVAPAVVKVERVSDTEILLTTDLELSFGAQYMLVVTGVEDEFDNVFEAPDNVANFNGWLPPYPEGRRWLLHDFVPRMSLAEDTSGDLRLFLGCLQDTNNLLLHLIDKWIEIIDPDLAPEDVIDAMLADLNNPFTFEIDLAAKRRLVKLLVRIGQLVGSSIGIIDVVRFFLGIEVTVETFTGRGWRLGHEQLSTHGHEAPNPAVIGPGRRALYSFRIRTDEILTAEQKTVILAIGKYMKGVQEHLIGIIDGSPPVIAPKYWTVGITKTGFAQIANEPEEPPPPPLSNSKEILSFVLSTAP